jgi:hypothetical protein
MAGERDDIEDMAGKGTRPPNLKNGIPCEAWSDWPHGSTLCNEPAVFAVERAVQVDMDVCAQHLGSVLQYAHDVVWPPRVLWLGPGMRPKKALERGGEEIARREADLFPPLPSPEKRAAIKRIADGALGRRGDTKPEGRSEHEHRPDDSGQRGLSPVVRVPRLDLRGGPPRPVRLRSGHRRSRPWRVTPSATSRLDTLGAVRSSWAPTTRGRWIIWNSDQPGYGWVVSVRFPSGIW